MTSRHILFAGLLSAGLGVPTGAIAATLHVEKWGNDTPACGAKQTPCKTIGHTISERARANDRVLVGPGYYEESVVVDTNSGGEALTGLKLESTAGRHATVIRTTLANSNAVSVHQSGVRIGKRNQGFTVGGADTAGYAAIEVFAGADRVRIEGNRVILSDSGMVVRGERAQVRYNVAETNKNQGILCSGCDRGLLRDNMSRGNGDHGFQVSGSSAFSFDRNVAAYNVGVGSVVEMNSDYYKARDNVSEFNDGHGFNLSESDGALIQGNIALVNHESGMLVNQSAHTRPPVIRNNAAIFNDEVGIVAGNVFQGRLDNNTAVDNDTNMLVIGASSYASIQGNNTYGAASGCGLTNSTGGPLSYTRHFFGDATGADDLIDADGHDAACGVPLPTGSHATKANRFGPKRAAKL